MKKLIALGLLLALPAIAGATTRVGVQTATKAGVTSPQLILTTSETWKFRNDGRTVLLFEKSGTAAGACTVTITTPGTVNGLAISDQTISVAASTASRKQAGPFPASLFNDASGDVSFTVTDTVGLVVAVVKF